MEDGYEASDGVPADRNRCECFGLGGWHCEQRKVQDSWFCNMHQNVYKLRNNCLRRERAGSRKCQIFNEGQLVEVISKDESLVDAWFTAKIIQLLPDRKNKIKVVIQYYNLLSGNNAVDPLTEKVDSSLLRPSPPPLQNKSFQLHQVVDAFCENGWWKGEIVETLENNTYSVYYSVWEEKKNFVAEDLRIHQDWIGGKWVISQPMNKDVKKSTLPICQKVLNEQCYQKDGDLRNTDTGKGSDQSKGNTHQSRPRGRPRKELPIIDARMSSLSEDLEKTMLSKISTRTGSCTYTNYMEKDFTLWDKYVETDDMANESDKIKSKTSQLRPRGRPRKITQEEVTRDSPILKDPKRTMPARTGVESCTSSNSMETNVTDLVDAYVSEVEGLLQKKNKLRHDPTSTFRSSSRILSDNQMTNCIQEQSTCVPSFNIFGTPQTLVNCSLSYEAQGELSNSQIQLPHTSSDFRSPQQSTESFYGDEIDQQQGGMEKQTNAILETKSPSKETALDYSMTDLQVALAHHNQVASQSETETIPRETLMELPPRGEGGFDHNTSQDRTDIFTKPLLVYQRSHRTTNSSSEISTSILDSDRHVNPTKYVVSSMSDVEQSNEVSLEDGTLLFTKTPSLWKTFDTMELFSSMPQRPHFRTLARLNENLREGMAISFMLRFVVVVEKTRTLQFNETSSSITKTLEALNDLEAAGFDVQPIQARLEKLLSIKTVLLELDVEMKQVEEEIIKENFEEKPESEIDEITENLRKLQESSANMMKKQDMLLMKKQSNDSDITVLQKSIREAKKEIQEMNLQFNSVAASLK